MGGGVEGEGRITVIVQYWGCPLTVFENRRGARILDAFTAQLREHPDEYLECPELLFVGMGPDDVFVSGPQPVVGIWRSLYGPKYGPFFHVAGFTTERTQEPPAQPAQVERRAMGQRAYLDYLDSPEWWAKRKRALARANYCCERCGLWAERFEIRQRLETHHLTYDRLGHEQPDDLEVLCSACHRNEHLPRNREKLVLELCGQQRLFDRWITDDVSEVEYKRAA
jgi:hypothetical protein